MGLHNHLITIQLLTKKICNLWSPKIRLGVQKIPPLDHILSQLNPVHILMLYFCRIKLNIFYFTSLKCIPHSLYSKYFVNTSAHQNNISLHVQIPVCPFFNKKNRKRMFMLPEAVNWKTLCLFLVRCRKIILSSHLCLSLTSNNFLMRLSDQNSHFQPKFSVHI
jgi:hypothetical protein